MSLHAISWAMKQQVARSSEKFVLVCLANYANENGVCYPSVAALESDTGQDRKTVIRGLQALVAAGWIVDTGKRAGATKQIPVYRLAFDNDPENGTVDKSSPKNGTVPETEQSQFSAETVPFFPVNSTVFPDKGSQKRDTEPSGTIKEPSRNRKKAQAPAPESIPLPDWLPLEAWQGYLDMRKANRWVPTAYAVELLLRDLEKWHGQGHDLEAILNKSTTANYRGIFPPDERAAPRYSAPRLTANQQMQQSVIGAIQGRSTRETFDVDATEVFTPLIAR